MLISYYIHVSTYISITYLLNSALFITYFWLKAWSTCIKILKSADRFSCVADKLLLWVHQNYCKFLDIVLLKIYTRVDNFGHFTWYLSFVLWPSMDFFLATFPPPPLLVHVVIEWPQTGSSSRSIWKHFNQFDKPIAMAVRARGWRSFACIAYSCYCSPPHQSCCLLLCRKDLSRKPSLSTRNSNSKEKRIKPFWS